jgi:hypothetical protein
MLFVSLFFLGANTRTHAANVYVHPGEGGAGLDAYIELDKSSQFYLAIYGCRKDNRKFDLGLGLDVESGNNLPSELEKLRSAEDEAKADFYLCINSICEVHQWQFLPTGFGDMFVTHFSIHRKHDAIRSIGVIVSDKGNYEYLGNVDAILNKICR